MIDKNIFQSWYTTSLHPSVKNKIEYYRNLNPEYKYHLFTDDDMDIFVNNNFEGEIADTYNKLNIIVAKVDFWRYLILYKYGGVYLDMDSSIEKPLNELIKEEDEAIITAEGNPNLYVQWALIFSKEHPILKKTIELVVDNIKNNKYLNDIHKMTGPTVYSKAINEVHKEIYGDIIEHKEIKRETDITFRNDKFSYRLFGIDYSQHFCFKYNESYYLYINKKHWREEEKEKNLLKN
jgi:mannosyltransferase OCH1-like enzyme